MYVLMNKDSEIARIKKEENDFEDIFILEPCDRDRLPIGFTDIEAWLDRRQASKHREHLRKLMSDCGCLSREGFIKFTHAASLNDTFWVKGIEEDISWDRISLYKNEFDETISRIAFEGTGLFGIQFSSTTPEFSTAGMFEKCWKREGEDIFLYKRGSTGARNAGLEPMSEIYAGQLASYICKGDSVKYKQGKLHRKESSKCKLFTDENIGFVPFSNIVSEKRHSIRECLSYFCGLGSEDSFRRMLIFDGIVFNTDRHSGNYGVLVNNDTQKIIKMAPVFDFNQALLPYALQEDLTYPEEYLKTKLPKLGDDFIRSAKAALTPEIRADLINLHGFHFDYIESARFDKNRLKQVEELVNRQIEGILDKSKMYMIDIYKGSTIEKLKKYKPGERETIQKNTIQER